MNTFFKLVLIAALAFTFAGAADAGSLTFSFGQNNHASKNSQKHGWKQSSSKNWGSKNSGKKAWGNHHGNHHTHNYGYKTRQVWCPPVTKHVFVGYVNGCKKYDQVIVKQGYYQTIRYRVCGCGHQIG